MQTSYGLGGLGELGSVCTLTKENRDFPRGLGNPIFDRGQNFLEKPKNFQIIIRFNYKSTVIFGGWSESPTMGGAGGSCLLKQKLEIQRERKPDVGFDQFRWVPKPELNQIFGSRTKTYE